MSTDLLSAFEFIDRDDFVHKLDPRTKIIMVLIYLILELMFNEILIQIFIILTLIPIIVAGNLTKSVLKSLKGMLFLFFFILFFNTLFDSFNKGIQMSLRFMNILITFSLLFQTTSPDELSQALTKTGVPYHIAFSLSLAFRFVPTLATELETITDAQKSRGLEVNKGGIIQQIKSFFPMLIPLISNSIQRAYYIAESLEARSFSTNLSKRTNLFPIKFKPKDYILLIWLIILILTAIFVAINQNMLLSWLLYDIPF